MVEAGEDARRRAIQALSRSVGASSGADGFAAAFFGLWQQTAGQLEPVIGAHGVDVLFGRALHLTARRYAWLPTSAHGHSAAPREVLQTCLAGRSAAEASDAGESLLLTFTGLLADMVGESLAGRLLGAGWAARDTHAQSQISTPA
ncbi:MAG: hypothetical protein ABIR55_08520 [Burkholderiaceae bacterium]